MSKRQPKMFILQGLPASGKSTWARQKAASEPWTVRVNKDDLRAMLFDNNWKPKRERQVIAARDGIIAAALGAGNDVIVDDTNLNPAHVVRLHQLADSYHATVEVVTFEISVDDAVARDAKRAHPVGEQVIRDMYRKYLAPTPEPQDETLPQAIIVDVDGTLADMGSRDPYRDDLAGADAPRQGVIDIIKALKAANPSLTVIVMSGRDEGRSREVTADWLDRHDVEYSMLLMRPAGDTRKDSIVKRQLFEQHIRGRFHVTAVFDDRTQVVRMWRDELGLNTMQVAWGDF